MIMETMRLCVEWKSHKLPTTYPFMKIMRMQMKLKRD